MYNRFVNPETKKDNVIFLPANMNDNPYLDAEEYSEMLDALDPVTRARLKDGNWTVVRKGNMFKREWFEAVEQLPMGRRSIRWWDMAATAESKKNKDPDWTVGAKVSEFQGVYYIEDIARVRCRPAETRSLQGLTASTDGKRVKIREEQEPGSSGVDVIDTKARTIFMGYDFKGIKSTGNKAARASNASSAAEGGRIKYLRGCRNIEAFFDEAESFPGGLHDDIVDAISGAINALGTKPAIGFPDTVRGVQDSYWTGLDETVDNMFTGGAGYFRQ